MIDYLRRKYYARRYGPEEGKRVAAVEERVARFYAHRMDHWATWLESVEPDWQLRAIEWIDARLLAQRAMSQVSQAVAEAERIQGVIATLRLKRSVAEHEVGALKPSDEEKLTRFQAALAGAIAAIEPAEAKAKELVAKALGLAEKLVEQGILDSTDPPVAPLRRMPGVDAGMKQQAGE